MHMLNNWRHYPSPRKSQNSYSNDASVILTYAFPLFNHALGAAKTCWIYAGICMAGFLFIKARLPETKGKTLQEIEDIWIQNES
jgi:hypothetical protein